MQINNKMNDAVIEFIKASFKTELDNENINRLIDAYVKEYASFVVEEDKIEACLLYDEDSYRIALLVGDNKEAIFTLFDAIKEEAKKKNIAKLSANVTDNQKTYFEEYGFIEGEKREDIPFVSMDYLLQNDVLGKSVTVIVDHPYGSFHPHRADVQYPINYGYILEDASVDSDMQNAYIYGIEEPLEEFSGVVVAIIYHLDDYQSRWVVASPLEKVTKDDIIQSVGFEEQHYDILIVM